MVGFQILITGQSRGLAFWKSSNKVVASFVLLPSYLKYLLLFDDSLSHEMLVTLLAGIIISPSPPEIKIMIIASVTLPLHSKELGGTADVILRIRMACIIMESTPPTLMASTGDTGRDITTL